MKRRHPRRTVSLVNQLTFFIVLLGIIGLFAMSISNWIAQNTTGSAYAINQLGTLRMKSYKLLTMVPLTSATQPYLAQFDQNLDDRKNLKMLDYYELAENYRAIQMEWQTNLRHQFQTAGTQMEMQTSVAEFVAQIDRLVNAVDQKTEIQIIRISYVQKLFILLIVLVMGVLIYYLRHRLLKPWNRLVTMAHAIANRDFSHRYHGTRHDELGIMGQALNHMSDEVSLRYADLEQRVDEKTQELQTKNQIVTFLYNSLQKLQTSAPICERFLFILHELERLTPLSYFQLRLYEPGHQDYSHQLAYALNERPAHCQHTACDTCLLTSTQNKQSSSPTQRWYLEDKNERYGIISAQLNEGEMLTDDHQRIIETLLEQMTLALTLEHQAEYQKQLILVQERSAIARELHDSIAQSLSCLKMKISCLQLNQETLSEKGAQLLKEMRNELNVAYSQLRELLTTFRLHLDKPGLYAGLQNTVDEYQQKLGFPITFDYRAPLQAISSHQAIHILQIVREALSNTYKHANANHVSITIESDAQEIVLTIQDDGIGLPQFWQKSDHYGMVIMQDRAELLGGKFSVNSQPSQGTTICVRFQPPLSL